jgi:hypothetical protein
MLNSKSDCLESTCQTWPILNEALDNKAQQVQQKVTEAKDIERRMLQQVHESDGTFTSTLVEEARFTADMETGIIEALRTKLQNEAKTCQGDRCVLAAYCVRAVVFDEVDLMT